MISLTCRDFPPFWSPFPVSFLPYESKRHTSSLLALRGLAATSILIGMYVVRHFRLVGGEIINMSISTLFHILDISVFYLSVCSVNHSSKNIAFVKFHLLIPGKKKIDSVTCLQSTEFTMKSFFRPKNYNLIITPVLCVSEKMRIWFIICISFHLITPQPPNPRRRCLTTVNVNIEISMILFRFMYFVKTLSSFALAL